MGYQLWTSDTTGHRRTGTRLSEMRRLFESNISTVAILESLLSCPADAPAQDMLFHLEKRDFDVAGVKEERDGPLIGFVRRSDLVSGIVRDHVKPFEESHLIADSTPLADTIALLSRHEFQFVLVGPEVHGIVVTADLNKPPVRIFLFGLVSLLEMHMTFWIRNAYGEDNWQSKISVNRLSEATKSFNAHKNRNQEISLLSCLQFCDKRDLFLGDPKIRSEIGISSRKSADRILRNAEGLRNFLAHSQDDLAIQLSWPDIASTVQHVETILKESDRKVEARAAALGAKNREVLWY